MLSGNDRDRGAGLEGLLYNPALLLVRSQPARPRAPAKGIGRNRFNRGVHLRSTWTRTTCPLTETHHQRGVTSALRGRHRTLTVETLERALPDVDIEQARADLRALLGSIRVVGDEQGIRFEAELRAT